MLRLTEHARGLESVNRVLWSWGRVPKSLAKDISVLKCGALENSNTGSAIPSPMLMSIPVDTYVMLALETKEGRLLISSGSIPFNRHNFCQVCLPTHLRAPS